MRFDISWEMNENAKYLSNCTTLNVKYVRTLIPKVIGKQFVYFYLKKKNVTEKKPCRVKATFY